MILVLEEFLGACTMCVRCTQKLTYTARAALWYAHAGLEQLFIAKNAKQPPRPPTNPLDFLL